MDKTIKIEDYANCPLPITAHDTVQLSHGSGGKMMNDLVVKLFRWAFDNSYLNAMDDQAIVEMGGTKIAISTDSFVVDPLFFPGGNIGELAVYGTVNDIAMCGSKPLFLSAAFIIEEGFPLKDLRNVVASMQSAAAKAGVLIVTGDTKVVNKGKGDKLFINTSGIGIIDHEFKLSASNLQAGDLLLLSGSIGDHGIAVMSQRENLTFESPVLSDTAPLNDMVQKMLEEGGEGIHAMRDPTRGGLATCLNEFASASGVEINIWEERLPINPAVQGACDLLGLDPLYVANEGKLVASVAAEKAESVLAVMRSHKLGQNAVIIGEVVGTESARVSLRTAIGGWRIVDMLVGDQLPRIC